MGSRPVEHSAGRRHARRILRYVLEVRLLFGAALVLLLALSGLTAAKAWIIQPAVDTFLGGNPTDADLMALCGAVVGIFLAQAAVGWTYLVVSQMAGARVIVRVREDLFRHLMKQNLGYFVDRRSSDLTSRVVNDAMVFNYAAIGTILNLVRDVVTLALLLGVMFTMDWRLACVSLAVLGVLGLFLRLITRRLGAVSRRVQEMLSKLVHQLGELVGGMEVILSFGMARRWTERFDEVNRTNYYAALRAQRTGATAGAAVMVIVGLGLGGILLLTGNSLLAGEITPGRFLSLLGAMYLVQRPLIEIGNGVGRIAAGLAAGGRALELLDDKPAIRDPEEPRPLPNPRGQVAFEGVFFAYGDALTVADLSFEIAPGELVVMVGDSGAGKSTVARLLLRFYDATEGRVRIDGVDVRELSRESLHRAASYVSQEVFLFDGTLELNLKAGRPDATREQVAGVLRLACLDEFVDSLPDGLATLVGERGVKISGGQRQRIAIARALLTDAPLLVLDEATSALDADLEARVLKNLRNSSRSRTVFAISHRLSLAAIANRVLVLKEGRLAEQGTAESLAGQRGEYARLRRAATALHGDTR